MKFEIEKLESYTIMPNYHLKDDRLNLATKGLLSIIYNLPNNWDYSIKGLCKITNTGITAIRNYIASLEIYGYIERVQKRTEEGKFEYKYFVYIKPKKVDPKRAISIKRTLSRI